jgi:hypothetical protein
MTDRAYDDQRDTLITPSASDDANVSPLALKDACNTALS